MPLWELMRSQKPSLQRFNLSLSAVFLFLFLLFCFLFLFYCVPFLIVDVPLLASTRGLHSAHERRHQLRPQYLTAREATQGRKLQASATLRPRKIKRRKKANEFVRAHHSETGKPGRRITNGINGKISKISNDEGQFEIARGIPAAR